MFKGRKDSQCTTDIYIFFKIMHLSIKTDTMQIVITFHSFDHTINVFEIEGLKRKYCLLFVIYILHISINSFYILTKFTIYLFN